MTAKGLSGAARRSLFDMALQYRPTDPAKQAEYQEKVDLLCADCVGLPDGWLGKACEQWRKSKPFLPRSSEIIWLAKSLQAADAAPPLASGTGYAFWLETAQQRNAANRFAEGNPANVRWVPRDSGDGMDPITVRELAREIHRARSLEAEGKPFDRQFLDVADAIE